MVNKKHYLCTAITKRNAIAQMAESVDALVSNTRGATHPGSIPGLGTQIGEHKFSYFLFLYIK